MQQIALPQEWLNWIKENVSRGCDVNMLTNIMVGKGYAPSLALQAITMIKEGKDVTSVSNNIAGAMMGGERVDYTYETPRVPLNTNYIDTSDKRVYIGMKMEKPTIMTFDNLMSPEECDELVKRSSGRMQQSRVVDDATGKESLHKDRTSEGTFFKFMEDDFIAMLDRRIAEVMHWPAENGEGIQILHYRPGGEYKAHFDYFPYDVAGSQRHLATGGQRVSTLVMYLNDVEQGGETTFPDIGVSVVPKKGSAVYFEYCNSKGQVDKLTLHAGNPVVKGEKWICTKWMRQNKYN